MKLFVSNERIGEGSSDKVVSTQEKGTEALEGLFDSLEGSVEGYVSVGIVYESIADKSLGFVDKKNYILFNEYVKVISKNLGIDKVPVISTESITNTPTLALNSQLALEGFVGKMWEKVRDLFRKIYEGIKAFFVKHFTRVGRLKKKLENLKEVLNETDKDIKQLNYEDVPSPISKAFPVSGNVGPDTVVKSLDIVKHVIVILDTVNKDAVALASKEVLDKDFVATVKNLKDQIKENTDKMSENDSKKVGGLSGIAGSGRATNKELNNENKSLSEINKEKESSLNSKESELNSIVGNKDNAGISTDDKAFEQVKRELADYYTEVAKVFKPLEGKPIPGGKVLKEATVNEDGITLEFDENKEEPSSVTLGGRDELKGLVNSMLSFIESLEKTTDNYSKVNDAVMSNIDKVDSLMKELDKVTDNDNYKSYKAVLEKKVRVRLKSMQKFFTEYNKISKNLIDVVASVGDGVVSYSVTSLKHFG